MTCKQEHNVRALLVKVHQGVKHLYSSPVASLVLTDSSQLTSDSSSRDDLDSLDSVDRQEIVWVVVKGSLEIPQ
uniref:Uncharacterized protein n=1 Tax=Timema shepardi TaxID=629360 RepID=A0A7R9G7J9_TIMSH|nr:unnamed protein product [Timema shepardi]